MNTSYQGRQLIEQSEGLRLQSYQDSAGIWTIGYGHTEGCVPNQHVTKQQADLLLADDLQTTEACVSSLVKVPLTQNQFDALVSFTFNLGCGTLKNSIVLSLLNSGSPRGAADQFLLYCHAGGKEVPGLMSRRIREREVFLNGYTEP